MLTSNISGPNHDNLPTSPSAWYQHLSLKVAAAMPVQDISYLTNVLCTHLVYCIVIAQIIHKIIQSQVMNNSCASLYKRIIVITVFFPLFV